MSASPQQLKIDAQAALVRKLKELLAKRQTAFQDQGSGAHTPNPSRAPQGSGQAAAGAEGLAAAIGPAESEPGEGQVTRKRRTAVQPNSMKAKMIKIEDNRLEIHRKMDETLVRQSQILKKLDGIFEEAKDCDEEKKKDGEEGEKEEEEEDEDEEEEEEEEEEKKENEE